MFAGQVYFFNNTGSALYAILSTLEFEAGTKATFLSNSGFYGGAVCLIGYSALQLGHNVTVNMTNNRASVLGGAIYQQSIDKHDYLYSKNCFVQLSDNNTKVLFHFMGNVAHGRTNNTHSKANFCSGNDIFMTTLQSCCYSLHGQCSLANFSGGHNIGELFTHVGKFQFNGNTSSVATSGAYFSYNASEPLLFIPGRTTEIPFELKDDLDQPVEGVFHILSKTDGINVENQNIYGADNHLSLGGKSNTSGIIEITKTGLRNVILSINITLDYCPPFFKHNNSTLMCECASNIHSKFKNIQECDNKLFRSKLIHGYWVGYNTSMNLWYGICPKKYCFLGNESNRYHLLPPSKKELDRVVCGNRTGVVCGQCREEFCAHYHSQSYICSSCATCNIGWLLYVVSELLPLTLLFIVVITFNIRFTSGYLNGFIFFSQVFDSVFTIGTGFVDFNRRMNLAKHVFKMTYNLFNVDFLVGDDRLSYCLWSEAKTIHLLSFKFITVAYAAVLVVITVLVMKRCAYSNRLLFCTKSVSMIHGLTAFLVMVYTQCTNISFQLLNYVWVYDLHRHRRKVLFYQGDMDLFSKQHGPFAFLAILCLCSLTLIPPLFLISYPLCYRIASLLRLENTKYSKLLGKLCPISKLKPVFDSFQGCFKDNYRHFAGLYFLYRVGLLASVLTSDPIMTFTSTQVQLSLILTIHCMCWPYVKRIHNISTLFSS